METKKISITDSAGNKFWGTGLPLAERRLITMDYGGAAAGLYRLLDEDGNKAFPAFIFVIQGEEPNFEIFDNLDHLFQVVQGVIKHDLEQGNTLRFPLMDCIRVASESHTEFIPVYKRLIEHEVALRAEQGPPPIQFVPVERG